MSQPAYADYFRKIPTRERCAVCNRLSRVGFYVPQNLWQAAVPKYLWTSILCLACFTDYADSQLLPWDKHITFHPQSRITHQTEVLGMTFDRISKEIEP